MKVESIMKFKCIPAALLFSAIVVGLTLSQPPGEGKGKGKGKGKGPPPQFVLGRIFPPPLREELKLTQEQSKELEAIENELKARLNKLLTAEQKKTAENFRPKGPGGPGPAPAPGGTGGADRPDRPAFETLPLPTAEAKVGPSGSTKKPNLVLILIDDLGYADIGPFGSKKNRTSNLDRMAREGMILTSFYACPVCTPSRAQFMTGCYAKRVSLPNVIFPAAAVGIHADERTLPELLKKQGYATVCIGKWHLGDQPDFLPTRRGFDRYFGIPYSNDMGPNHKAAKNTPLPLLRDEKVIETVSPEGQGQLTARYTDEAVAFLKENKDRPFFLYLPHTAVHNPHHPGEAFRGKSKNGVYGDWVEEVDWSVSRVLDTLRELKLDKDTLVLFTSDNGGTRAGDNAPLRGFKASTWEGGMREPTVAWWPGKVPGGASCDAVAGNIDVLPTFVKLAGREVPQDRKIDGKDISALLFGKTKESPHQAYFYFNRNVLEAVRSGPWKLFLGEDTLYNLDSDIGESTNVANKNPDVVKKLRGYAATMDADLGAGAKPGPGVRPPGRVDGPKPLRLLK